MRLRRYVLAAFLVPAGVVGGCATQTNLVTGEQQRAALSWAEEVRLGAEADQQVIAQFGLYDDAALTAYVQEVGQRVLQSSAYGVDTTPAEIRNTPFHFRVLDSPVVNAMALPGGYIYVTRGLMAHLDNEAQLAVVLGHEIGHVLARHASRRMANQQLGTIGLLGAAILGGVVTNNAAVTEGIANYGGAGLQLIFLRHGREDERESDRAGVAYAEFAGYDAASAGRLFRALERISQVEGASVPTFLSTHPSPHDRQQTIPQLAAQYDGTVVNADEYLARIQGMVLGDDPRQGFVEADVFYHPELRFRFNVPRGWRVNNTAAAVQIGEPNGRASMEFTFAQEQTAEAAARAFASQQGLQVSDQRAVSLGSRAVRLQGVATTQQGQLGFLVYFIEYGGRVYRFTGLAAANNFGTYQAAMDAAIRSFDRLTDARQLGRQPVRLDVVRAPRAGAFSTFIQGRPMPFGMDATRLSIMNQVDVNENVPAGAPLKLPVG